LLDADLSDEDDESEEEVNLEAIRNKFKEEKMAYIVWKKMRI